MSKNIAISWESVNHAKDKVYDKFIELLKHKNINIQKIFNIIGKYSYAIFLVHHYIIMKIESTFTNKTLRISETICLYITCWIVIGICAKILYVLNKNIQNLFKIEQKRTTKSRIIRK